MSILLAQVAQRWLLVSWGYGEQIVIDSCGIEYDPFFPSVATQNGAVFQVLITNEDGEIVCDMEQSSALVNEYINDK